MRKVRQRPGTCLSVTLLFSKKPRDGQGSDVALLTLIELTAGAGLGNQEHAAVSKAQALPSMTYLQNRAD